VQLPVVASAEADEARPTQHVARGEIENASRSVFGIVEAAVAQLVRPHFADFGQHLCAKRSRLKLEVGERECAGVVKIASRLAELLRRDWLPRLEAELGSDEIGTRVPVPLDLHLPDHLLLSRRHAIGQVHCLGILVLGHFHGGLGFGVPLLFELLLDAFGATIGLGRYVGLT
jgi:hypothetical protein